MDSDLRSALLHQQMVSQISLVDETQSSRLPLEVDAYHHLMPLESIGLKSLTLNPILTSTFRVNHRNGLNYCMKRIHGKILYNNILSIPDVFLACRNVSKSGLSTLEKWKSMSHSNIVSLHEVFTTKAFQDQSLVFIYDFHPASDTLLDMYEVTYFYTDEFFFAKIIYSPIKNENFFLRIFLGFFIPKKNSSLELFPQYLL